MTAELKHPETEASRRLLTLREVESITSLKKSTIYHLISLGRFPAPVAASAGRSAWVLSEVQAWISARIAHRRLSYTVGKGGVS